MGCTSKNNKDAKISLDTLGICYSWCTSHNGMGMISVIIVGMIYETKDDVASSAAIGKIKKKLKTLLPSLI